MSTTKDRIDGLYFGNRVLSFEHGFPARLPQKVFQLGNLF